MRNSTRDTAQVRLNKSATGSTLSQRPVWGVGHTGHTEICASLYRSFQHCLSLAIPPQRLTTPRKDDRAPSAPIPLALALFRLSHICLRRLPHEVQGRVWLLVSQECEG